jgi:hypothetical protein
MERTGVRLFGARGTGHGARGAGHGARCTGHGVRGTGCGAGRFRFWILDWNEKLVADDGWGTLVEAPLIGCGGALRPMERGVGGGA